jgi:hypothetical protein
MNGALNFNYSFCLFRLLTLGSWQDIRLYWVSLKKQFSNSFELLFILEIGKLTKLKSNLGYVYT